MDKTAKVYLNMILSETEPVETVKRAINSIQNHVDGMYITITYGDQKPYGTPLEKFLKSLGVHITYFKWIDDFSAARQFAMDQAPKGPDCYIFWMDADDVVRGAEQLKTIANQSLKALVAAVFFTYYYMVDLDDKGDIREVLIEHKRERLIRNDDTFKWVGMLHEVLVEQRTENIQKIGRNEVNVVHLSDSDRMGKGLVRNIRILEKQAEKEQHKDPRTLIYLAKAYYDRAKISSDPSERTVNLNLALTLFYEYLQGAGKPGSVAYQQGSGWPEERSTAWQYISEIAILSGHPEIALEALQSAIDEAPQFPNYYVDKAMVYAMMGDMKKAKHWLQLATAVPQPDTTIITTPRDLKARALEVASQVAFAEGKLDAARQHLEQLIEIFPNSEELKTRLQVAVSLDAANKAAQSIVYLGKYLEQMKEPAKIESLVQAIPSGLQNEKFAAEMRHLFLPPRVHEKNEISILCGFAYEKWSPKSIETGLGGSEEAVVYLSEELTKLGWKVTVYGNPQEDAGNYNGVEYKMWHDINIKDEFNVLVLWRSIGFVDFNPKAKYKLLWMHDVPNNPDFTEERVSRVDKIAVLSDFHKTLFRMTKGAGVFEKIPDYKFFRTANGIPPITGEWKGNPHRIIYASSLDRGLIYLLQHWQEVRAEVSDAELHIFYGFEIYDVIHKNNPERKKFKDYLLSLMKQDGIVYHGRVGHKELNEEYAKSGIWAYPTNFEEISCISAMKAQALGAIPVVTDYAALQETVRNGLRVDADITTPEGQSAFVKGLIHLLQDSNRQNEIRPDMVKWARNYFSWASVAEQWNQLFKINIQNPDAVYATRNKPTD